MLRNTKQHGLETNKIHLHRKKKNNMSCNERTTQLGLILAWSWKERLDVDQTSGSWWELYTQLRIAFSKKAYDNLIDSTDYVSI